MNAMSVKDRLKNLAKTEGGTLQEKLMSYGMERTIYRISVSPYADHFILKGGIFLYALFNGNYARSTVDIDLLAKQTSNNAQNMFTIFQEILSIESDDALRYDLSSLVVKNITEFKKYHGVNISVTAYLDRTRIPISIDIGFGDVIYPNCIEMEFPVLLNMETPRIKAYSVYSVIAEKFEAITSLGTVNSRFKDFYDIYILAGNFDLNGSDLKNAIMETFSHRHTGFDDIVVFDDAFSDDAMRQTGWNAFIQKKRTTENVQFDIVTRAIQCLLQPVIDAVIHNKVFEMHWDKRSRMWLQ